MQHLKSLLALTLHTWYFILAISVINLTYNIKALNTGTHLKSMMAVAGRWVVEKQLETMQRAIRERHLGAAFPWAHKARLCMYAHTYVASVNITWSVSNLVPQLIDSVHCVERPVMWSRGQHLQAWTESSRINKDPEKGFSPNQALSHYSKFIFLALPSGF